LGVGFGAGSGVGLGVGFGVGSGAGLGVGFGVGSDSCFGMLGGTSGGGIGRGRAGMIELFAWGGSRRETAPGLAEPALGTGFPAGIETGGGPADFAGMRELVASRFAGGD
jgi:hypothetical protein